MNYNLQIEQSLANNVVAQLGYVGSEGRHLLSILDINQAAPGVYATEAQQNATRPYYAQFPGYSFINEVRSIGTSNYNALQATVRVSNKHGISAQGAYTWSHSLDEVTAYRGALPQDSTNFKGDYGNSDFNMHNIFVGLISYDIPGASRWRGLTNGWQLNSLTTFHGGLPFSVYSSSDTSGTDDNNAARRHCSWRESVQWRPTGKGRRRMAESGRVRRCGSWHLGRFPPQWLLRTWL